MNYFSHFVLDGRRNDPYYNLGLVLPDVMGMYQRGWKVGHSYEAEHADIEHFNLLNGVLRHHEVDRIFHTSDFFLTNKKRIKDIYLEEGISDTHYRIFFLAHIHLELMLDRVMVKKYSNFALTMYDELNNIEKDILFKFFKITETPVYEPFFDFFQRFIQKNNIFHYTDDQSFLKLINQVSQRVNLPAITNSHADAFFKVITKTETLLEERYKDALLEVKNAGI